MVELSFVVIAKNEATNIARCLQSCWASAAEAGVSAEIILADSSSTDDTVGISGPLATTVVLLPDVNAPFAGRLVGGDLAKGEFIQFVDGDMELAAPWVATGLAALKANARVGAVAGLTREAVLNENLRRMHARARIRERAEIVGSEPEVLWGGAILVRAGALRQIGGFNPFLVGLEQLDLSWRMRRAGYVLRRLDTPMSLHHGYVKPLTLRQEGEKRWRTYFLGEGYLLRYYTKRCPDLAPLLAARASRGVIIVLFEVCAVLMWLALGQLLGLAALGAGMIGTAVCAATAARSRRARDLSRSTIWANLSVAGLVVGFFAERRMPEEYPLHQVVVNEGGARPPAPNKSPSTPS